MNRSMHRLCTTELCKHVVEFNYFLLFAEKLPAYGKINCILRFKNVPIRMEITVRNNHVQKLVNF